MAFTVSDLQDMIQLLEQRPEWKQVLRTVLLTEELLNLPQLVAQLVAIQRQQAQELEAMRTEFRTEIGALRSELEATRAEFRTEIGALRSELEATRAELRAEMGEMRSELRAEMGEMRSEIRAEMDEMRSEFRTELEATRAEFRTEIGALRSEFRTELEATRAEFRTELARFTTKLGLEIEEEASEILLWVMEQKGWQPVEGPYALAMNGEVDVVAVFANEQGQRITVLMEVKLRLNRRTVDAWANRVRSEGFLRRLQRHGLTPPYWIYLFGFRIDRTAAKRAEQRQVGVMTARGEMFPPVELS
jgi:Skp family chaperone for outer membrane proteins